VVGVVVGVTVFEGVIVGVTERETVLVGVTVLVTVLVGVTLEVMVGVLVGEGVGIIAPIFLFGAPINIDPDSCSSPVSYE
jgi:hypothetical protein